MTFAISEGKVIKLGRAANLVKCIHAKYNAEFPKESFKGKFEFDPVHGVVGIVYFRICYYSFGGNKVLIPEGHNCVELRNVLKKQPVEDKTIGFRRRHSKLISNLEGIVDFGFNVRCAPEYMEDTYPYFIPLLHNCSNGGWHRYSDSELQQARDRVKHINELIKTISPYREKKEKGFAICREVTLPTGDLGTLQQVLCIRISNPEKLDTYKLKEILQVIKENGDNALLDTNIPYNYCIWKPWVY